MKQWAGMSKCPGCQEARAERKRRKSGRRLWFPIPGLPVAQRVGWEWDGKTLNASAELFFGPSGYVIRRTQYVAGRGLVGVSRSNR